DSIVVDVVEDVARYGQAVVAQFGDAAVEVVERRVSDGHRRAAADQQSVDAGGVLRIAGDRVPGEDDVVSAVDPERIRGRRSHRCQIQIFELEARTVGHRELGQAGRVGRISRGDDDRVREVKVAEVGPRI